MLGFSVVIIYFSGNYLSYHPDETKRHREEQCTRRSRALGWLMLVSARGLNHDTSPKARGTKRLAPELFIESTNPSLPVVPLCGTVMTDHQNFSWTPFTCDYHN